MKLKLVFASALLVASSSAAFAATVTVNHVYNPANILPVSLTGEALATPITLGVGDTLDLTLTFTGGSTVFANSEDGLWGLLLIPSGGLNATLETTGSLEFLGASANVVSGPIAMAQQNLSAHIGNYYGSGLYRLDAAQISFTGLRQIITIDSDDIGTPREYDRVILTYFQGNVGGAVPEPAAWAMLIAGFGLVGAASRRQRAAQAAA
jgi:hypothetical protein